MTMTQTTRPAMRSQRPNPDQGANVGLPSASKGARGPCKGSKRKAAHSAAGKLAAWHGRDGSRADLREVTSPDGQMTFRLKQVPTGTFIEQIYMREAPASKAAVAKARQGAALSRICITNIVPDLRALDDFIDGDPKRHDHPIVYAALRREFLALQDATTENDHER